jgi:cell division septal protein FtsQ
MIKRNKIFLLIFFFIIFTSYNFNEKKQNLSIIFPIKKIIIEGTNAIDLIKLKLELEFLRNTSLFFLKEEDIIKVSDKYNFISSIQLKKKYPNTLRILISEYIPVATEIGDTNRYYLTKLGKKINYIDLKIFENLPVIFCNHKNFSTFFTTLEKSNFKINSIKAFYYFNIGRWDIVLKDKTTIKLPEINYQKILLEINSVLVDPNFSEYKIFDYRVKDQLILQ